MKRCKKLLAVGLSVVMMISSSMMVFAEGTTSTEDAIIAQAVALDENFNLEEYEFAVVNLVGDTNNSRSVEEGEKAIQLLESEDGITTMTTILPFKVLEDGEVINSFDYVDNVTARSGGNKDNVLTFVDITITYRYSYETVISGGNYYYRHIGITAYWSSDNHPISSVHDFNFSYVTNGHIYNYQNNQVTTLKATNTSTSTVISVVYPEIDYLFSDYNVNQATEVIDTMGAPGFGGYLGIYISFFTNGAVQYYDPLEVKIYS